MKKFLSMALALAMAAALAVPAMAAEEVVANNEASIAADGVESSKTVTVAVTNGTDGATTIVNRYYVTVEWTINNAAYQAAGTDGTTYTWNGAIQKYETPTTDGSAAVETAGSAKVVVTNKSDMDIKVSSSYTPTLADSAWVGADAAESTIAKVEGTGTLEAAKANQDYSGVTPSSKTYEGAVTFGDTKPTADGEMGTVKVIIKAA